MTVPTPHLWLPYTQMQGYPEPLRAARTVGTRIILDDGRELIDAVASWWTACHGYNHPQIVMAMERQLHTMPHVMFGGLVHEPAETLAARLAVMLPGPLNRVFFADSGSVAVEVAMKMAVQYWINRGERGRTRFLSFRDGYHGDTLAAMSVTDPDEGMHALFKGYLPEQVIAPVPRDDASTAEFAQLLRDNKSEIAAVIIEPLVQCAGGMKMHASETLKAIADAAGVPASDPFVPNAYDATFMIALAIEKAGSADREGIAAALREIASAPGEVILPGEWEKAKGILAKGGDINYEGAAGNQDFDENGDVAGLFSMSSVVDGAWAATLIK